MKGEVSTLTYLLIFVITLAFVSSYYVFVNDLVSSQQNYGIQGTQNIAQNAQQFIDEAKQKYGYSTNEQVIEQQFSPQRIDTQVSEATNPSSSTTYVFAGSQMLYHDNGMNNVVYNHPDYLGSARLSTNEAGQKVAEERYYPFGSSLTKENDASASQRFTFTSKEKDLSSLMYYGARYYDPEIGRFYEVDPVKGENAYAYVSNNPLKFIDPSGNEPEWVQTPTEKTPQELQKSYEDYIHEAGKNTIQMNQDIYDLGKNKARRLPDCGDLVCSNLAIWSEIVEGRELVIKIRGRTFARSDYEHITDFEEALRKFVGSQNIPELSKKLNKKQAIETGDIRPGDMIVIPPRRTRRGSIVGHIVTITDVLKKNDKITGFIIMESSLRRGTGTVPRSREITIYNPLVRNKKSDFYRFDVSTLLGEFMKEPD